MKTIRPTRVVPKTRRWTRDEYYRMGEMGWFDGQRVELIEGRIVEMPPQKESHYATILRVQDVLRTAFGAGHVVRPQGPLAIGARSEPEPDVAVVRGNSRDYTDHPTTALLVVEVSGTTLRFDRRKAGLYAKANVPEYWIVNLSDREIEVRREPMEDDTKPFRHAYRTTVTYKAGDVIAPIAAPSAQFAVSDLLP
jgi:Uma2 family endonuclease